MEKRTLSPYPIAFGLALLFIIGALGYKMFINQPHESGRQIPTVMAPDTTHTHTSLLIMIKNAPINFCSKQFMLRSPIAHFEDNDCYVVHKHSVGVTLPVFLKTIGVGVSSSCIILPNASKYCSDDTNSIRAVINGKELGIEELAYYELQNNDHILVNYGPETGALLLLKYNQIPAIPLSVNEPK